MRRTRLRAASTATLTLSVLAAIALTGSPANADSPGWINAEFDASSITLPAHAASSRSVVTMVIATGSYTEGLVSFDFGDLAGIATATLPAQYGCTATGSMVTCPVAGIADDSQQELEFDVTVTSTAAAVDGATGSMSVSTSVDGNVSDGPNTISVTVSDAPELDTVPDVPDQNVDPGDAVSLPLDIANLGSEPAPGVQIVFDISHGIAPATYDNCLYAPWPADNGTFVACTMPGTIEVGQQVKIHNGFGGTVAADSPGFARADGFVFATSATSPTAPTGDDWQGVTFTARPASGQDLTLDAEANDGSITGGQWPGRTWAFQVATATDMAAVGATLPGNVGDTVNATVGIEDLGPAALDSFSSHDPVASFLFTVPAWATAVSVPSNCDGMNTLSGGQVTGGLGMKYYQCYSADTYVMSVGETLSATIGLRITSSTGTDGQVAIFEDGTYPDDTNPANNIAPVTLSDAGDSFIPLTPDRILDTRSGVGAPKARVGAGDVVALQVDGVGGVPSAGVTAVVMNVTAVHPTATSYITVYPDGQTRPNASNINVVAGQTIPNLITVPVVNGKVDLRNNAGIVDLLADITGYYTSDGTGSALNTVGPIRTLDTRIGLGAPTARVGAGGTVALQVAGVGGVPATGVSAVIMNVTAVNPTATSYVTVYPDGQARPNASNLNLAAGRTIANLVIVPVVDGKVDIFNDAGSVDLLADVTGYFASSGAGFHPAGPVRLMDTRSGVGAPKAAVGPGQTVALQVVGANGVPLTGVTAVVLNVTATRGTSGSHLTVYPDGESLPNVSNVNFAAGETIANLVVVPVINGKIDFRNSSGSVEIVADLEGYFES